MTRFPLSRSFSQCRLLIVALVAVSACTDSTPPSAPMAPELGLSARGGTSGPTVKSTAPDTATIDSTLDVHVFGSGFDVGSRAQWALNGVPSGKVVTNSTSFVSSTELVANITIAPDAPLASYDVIVTTSSGKGGIGTELFVITAKATDLGTLPGDVRSSAVDVNDAGYIAGSSESTSNPGSRGFVRVGTTMIPLSDVTIFSRGLGISNGNPVYVVGDYAYDGNSHPARWTVDPNAGTATVTHLSSGFGNADGVNDAGAAVGFTGSDAVVWDANGTAEIMVPPVANTFTSGLGRDINNAGYVLVNFTGASYTRTYLRAANKQWIELPPQSGDVSTFGRRVSEVSGTTIYVAGTSYRNDRSFHAMRWTVDVVSNTIVKTESRSETSSSSDVSTSGAVSGSLEGRQTNTPFIWRLSGLSTLRPPKSGSNAQASGINYSGNAVVGQALFGARQHAVLWTLPSP
jgi:hypothetical protein